MNFVNIYLLLVQSSRVMNSSKQIESLNIIAGKIKDLKGITELENLISLGSNPPLTEVPSENNKLQIKGNNTSLEKSDYANRSENITLFPNPVKDNIHIVFTGYEGQSIDIIVYDMLGKAVLTQHIDKMQETLHTISLGAKTYSGQYLLRIKGSTTQDVIKIFTVGR